MKTAWWRWLWMWPFIKLARVQHALDQTKAMHQMSLQGELEAKEALEKECTEHSTTRALYVESIQDRMELKDKLRRLPTIEAEKLRKLVAYSFRELKGYAGLTPAERRILTLEDYEQLRAWALGRK